MVDNLENNFASLTIPLDHLRNYADITLRDNPSQLAQNTPTPSLKELIDRDIFAALAAGRRGDGNTLNGKAMVSEVLDKNSPFFGESAFRIFSRAVAFENILALSHDVLPDCPNQEIKNFSTPVKFLRDYRFLNPNEANPVGLFPKTAALRDEFAANLEAGLMKAKEDGDLNTLAGWEVLKEGGFTCGDIKAVDIFWQSAVANSLLQPANVASAIVPSLGVQISTSPQLPVPTLGGQTLPGGTTLPQVPIADGSSIPGTPNPLASDEDPAQLAYDIFSGAADASFAGGGLILQRGKVKEYRMVFDNNPAPTKPVNPRLLEVNSKPLPIVEGVEETPIDTQVFMREKPKMFAKARDEATVLFRRENPPPKVTRPAAETGWVKGSISLRRVFGWLGVAFAVADTSFKFFRKDHKGLSGPLSDAGMEPVGSELAVIGGGVAITAAAVLAAGLAAPAAIGWALFSGAAVAYDLYATLQEAHQSADAALENSLQALRSGAAPQGRPPSDPSQKKSDPATSRFSPLVC